MHTARTRPARVWLATLVLLTVQTVQAAPDLSAAERAAASRVRAETIRRITAELAAPGMAGRGTGQPGGDRAASYIAARMADIGLEPLGDGGTFVQDVPVIAAELLPGSQVAAGEARLAPATDFVVAAPLTAESATVEGAL